MAGTVPRPALTRAAALRGFQLYRFTETALGIVIAVPVSLLPKVLNRSGDPRG